MTIHIGEALAVLKTLPGDSCRTCVTSPPYYGLRDYGHADQLGAEKTPDAYVTRLVDIFREVRRVLTHDGTFWLNIGDSYGKRKQLLGVPWRLAFALQDDGWTLRADCIWNKTNALPDAATDRPTRSHEYVFLFSKGPRYHCSMSAVRVKAGKPKPAGRKNDASRNDSDRTGVIRGDGLTRNLRTVWDVATSPYRGSHFAPFPPALIEPCILAGSAPGDTVLDPFAGSGTTGMVAAYHGREFVGIELNPEYAALAEERITKGWGRKS